MYQCKRSRKQVYVLLPTFFLWTTREKMREGVSENIFAHFHLLSGLQTNVGDTTIQHIQMESQDTHLHYFTCRTKISKVFLQRYLRKFRRYYSKTHCNKLFRNPSENFSFVIHILIPVVWHCRCSPGERREVLYWSAVVSSLLISERIQNFFLDDPRISYFQPFPLNVHLEKLMAKNTQWNTQNWGLQSLNNLFV